MSYSVRVTGGAGSGLGVAVIDCDDRIFRILKLLGGALRAWISKPALGIAAAGAVWLPQTKDPRHNLANVLLQPCAIVLIDTPVSQSCLPSLSRFPSLE